MTLLSIFSILVIFISYYIIVHKAFHYILIDSRSPKETAPFPIVQL